MNIHFFAKLSGFLFFLVSCTVFLPLPDSFFCPGLVFSREFKTFGSRGSSGSDGSRGEDGRDGRSRTIFLDDVDDAELSLDLSGKDGSDGEDGEDGDDATSCRQPSKGDRDRQGASGGDGGDGGRGGDGGDGGSLTVYYTNIEDLKKIYVVAEGGRGGSGGSWGSGGDGCECRDRSWQAEVCTGDPGNPDYSCETRSFICRDGDRGDSGDFGGSGSNGKLGKLTLIPGNEVVPADEPAIPVSFSQVSDRTFNLSRNFWSVRTGATDLLADGSVIDDEYRHFIERIERSVQVVWNASRSPADFGDFRASVRLNEDKTVDIWVPEELWLATTEVREDDRTQLVVSHAIPADEVTDLRLVDVAENGQNLQLVLIDMAGYSDAIETEFELIYETSPSAPTGRFDDNYQTRYQGQIPSELVDLKSNRFTINMGQLPIEQEYLRGGLNFKLELRIVRTLGDRSAAQIITSRGAIRR